MKPPSGGPITGPTSAGTVTQAIALTSALLSMERSSTSRPTGVIIAPPAPCRMRAITKWLTEVDSAQPIEPIMKTATARLNTMRAPKRSAVQPLAGMNTASDNRYEVMASFSVSGLVPISAAIAGSEVAITVESMFSMNRAVATMSGISLCLSSTYRMTKVSRGYFFQSLPNLFPESSLGYAQGVAFLARCASKSSMPAFAKLLLRAT